MRAEICGKKDRADQGDSALICPCGGATLPTATRERPLSLSEFCAIFFSLHCALGRVVWSVTMSEMKQTCKCFKAPLRPNLPLQTSSHSDLLAQRFMEKHECCMSTIISAVLYGFHDSSHMDKHFECKSSRQCSPQNFNSGV